MPEAIIIPSTVPKDQNKLSRGLIAIPTAALAVSWAAIFIRFADAPPLVTAFYRLLFAVLILTPWALGPQRSWWRVFDRRIFYLTVLSGFFLALHFATWIASLDFTPVANSVMLVSTAPIFAAVLGHVFLKERPRPLAYLAILLAIGGGGIILSGDFRWAPEQIRGDVLALLGAVAVAGYFLLGRLIQRKITVFPYIFLAYSSAAVWLGVFAVVAGDSFSGYPRSTWLWFFLLGLVPTVIGHSLYNRALRFFKTHVVGACVLTEPIGATILAWLFLAEIPPWYALLGAVPIFAGVAWVFWLERKG